MYVNNGYVAYENKGIRPIIKVNMIVLIIKFYLIFLLLLRIYGKIYVDYCS